MSQRQLQPNYIFGSYVASHPRGMACSFAEKGFCFCRIYRMKSFLAFAYLAYFGVLGVFVPYIGLYLDSRGLNSHDIGLLLAIVTGMRIIGPSLWGAIR
ncbi:MAG: MFS transporter [Rheinheimera sp.]|nr:MFS transporter [Rheinheimera sp.]